MTQDNLLRSAIADANAIRETAIANAKEIMLENFKPQVDNIVTKALRKETLEDTSKIGGKKVTVDNPGPTDPSKASWDSSDVGEDGLSGSEVEPLGKGKVVESDDATGSMSDSNNGVPFGKGKDQEKVKLPEGELPGMGAGELDIELEPELGGGEELELGLGGQPGEDELDLEAIIKELEADGEPNFPKDPRDGYGAGQGGEGTYDVPKQIPVPDAFPDKPARDGYGSDEGGKGTQVKTEDWDDPMAGKKVDGWKTDSKFKTEDNKASSSKTTDGAGGKEVKPGDKVTEDEHSLEEILREIEADGSVTESEKIANENVELKRSLREHREVIQHLRGRMNEINMLNSKLLYTNKLFRAFELNGAQKMNIVETFDRCSTLREVKLVYATTAENLGGKFGKKQKSITESLGSKPVGSTKPKSEELITEAADEVVRDRLRKLAGIRKQVL